jgi:hypothetical protein
MIDEEVTTAVTEEESSFLGKHRFLVLIGSSITVALILVIISMEMYANSGAAQLDLSRPGYRSVSSQAITSDNSFEDYPDSGPINQDSIDTFKNLFDKQSQKVKAIDAFSGDPLNPTALEISDPTQ